MHLTLRKQFKWSSNLAYAVGLLATDGSLSSDGRHINLTSKDKIQIENFLFCIGGTYKLGEKKGGYTGDSYYYTQFSDVNLYRFLCKSGLHPNKSKTLKSVSFPDKYFFDFLRGCMDGDGCCYSYKDKRWPNSIAIYLQFTSGSSEFIYWLKNKIEGFLGLRGSVKTATRAHNLVYAKKASVLLVKRMFRGKDCVSLPRKKEKIRKILLKAGVLEW